MTTWLRNDEGGVPARIWHSCILYHTRSSSSSPFICTASSLQPLENDTDDLINGKAQGWLPLCPSTCFACASFVSDLKVASAISAGVYGFVEDPKFESTFVLSPLAIAIGGSVSVPSIGSAAFKGTLAAPQADALDDTPIEVSVIVERLRSSGFDSRIALLEGSIVTLASTLCPYNLRLFGLLLAKAEDTNASLQPPTPASVAALLAESTTQAPSVCFVLERSSPVVTVLKRATMTQRIVLITQTAIALFSMHSLGLFHGFFSINNVSISLDGETRLIGAGLFKTSTAINRANKIDRTDDDDVNIRTAPEERRSQQASCEGDAYSLGVFIWEMLTTLNDPSNHLDTSTGRPDLNKLPSDIPLNAQQLITSLWSEYPHNRPTIESVVETMLDACTSVVPDEPLEAMRSKFEEAKSELPSIAISFKSLLSIQLLDKVKPKSSQSIAVPTPTKDIVIGSMTRSQLLKMKLNAISSKQPSTMTVKTTTSSTSTLHASERAIEAGPNLSEPTMFFADSNKANDAVQELTPQLPSFKSQQQSQQKPTTTSDRPKSLQQQLLEKKLASLSTAVKEPVRSYTPNETEEVIVNMTPTLRSTPFARPVSLPNTQSVSQPVSSVIQPSVPVPVTASKFIASAGLEAYSAPPQSSPSMQPRVVLTPVRMKDPPHWDIESTHQMEIPASINELFLPLPPSAAANCACAVVVPFYSEEGFALRRGLEALAQQRSDLRRFRARQNFLEGIPTSSLSLPEIHVFSIADGWRKPDGNYIVSDSMFQEICNVFGDTLNVDELVSLLEPKDNKSLAAGDAEKLDSDDADKPEHDGVLIQFAVPMSQNSFGTKTLGKKMQLHPIPLDVSWSQSMVCRSSYTAGQATDLMQKADKKRAMFSSNEDKNNATTALGGVLKGRTAIAYADTSDKTRVQKDCNNVIDSEDSLSESHEQPIFVSLLIKRQNAKKHHSHRWFFEVFAPLTRIRSGGACKYFFATDCGTLYAPFCIAELMYHLDKNKRCAAATGHQRIMDKFDQGDPTSVDAETFVQTALRNVQGYDFESGLCTFNGMHALAGFLPVVPGPCGMFRAAALTDEIISTVRDIVSSPPELDGLIQGNLKIAEDRILSYLLVLVEPKEASLSQQSGYKVGKSNWETHWVPTTVFFFESEDNLKELVLQRRRWLNGTTAGYIWLITQPTLWRGVAMLKFMSWKVALLALLQLIVFSIVFIMPGIFIVTGSLALSGFLLVLDIVGVKGAFAATGTVQLLYLVISVISYLAHVGLARCGKRNFEPIVWYIRASLGAMIMFVNAFVLVALLCISYFPGQADKIEGLISKENFRDMYVATSFGMLFATTPFYLSYLHSRASFVTMLSTFPFYFFFMPTILADFFAYSASRLDDLSWGTKATPVKAGGSGEKGRIARAAAVRKALAGRQNEASGTALRAEMRNMREAQRRNAAAKESMSQWVNVIAVMQVFLSLSIAVINFALSGAVVHYLLYAGFFTASLGLIVQIMSFIYFTQRALCGYGAGNLLERVFALLSTFGWIIMMYFTATLLFIDVNDQRQTWDLNFLIYCSTGVGVIVLAGVRFFLCPSREDSSEQIYGCCSNNSRQGASKSLLSERNDEDEDDEEEDAWFR
jgi:cellulose synthase/poly-beta-1,6-N-acetylglucosamine synthase-like glycosyltransferase